MTYVIYIDLWRVVVYYILLSGFILYFFSRICWKNGVLQLVSEQVGPSGQVFESRSVVWQFTTVFMLS